MLFISRMEQQIFLCFSSSLGASMSTTLRL